MTSVLWNVGVVWPRGYRFCLQVGATAVCFGRHPGVGARLELLTPYHVFRWMGAG